MKRTLRSQGVRSLLVGLGGAIAVLLPSALASRNDPGAHGFSELLYAFSSAGNNNGSAFAGLNANTPFFNTALGLAMLFARYWVMIPALAMSGATEPSGGPAAHGAWRGRYPRAESVEVRARVGYRVAPQNGSAWQNEPPTVPRLRTGGSAIRRSASWRIA